MSAKRNILGRFKFAGVGYNVLNHNREYNQGSDESF